MEGAPLSPALPLAALGLALLLLSGGSAMGPHKDSQAWTWTTPANAMDRIVMPMGPRTSSRMGTGALPQRLGVHYFEAQPRLSSGAKPAPLEEELPRQGSPAQTSMRCVGLAALAGAAVLYLRQFLPSEDTPPMAWAAAATADEDDEPAEDPKPPATAPAPPPPPTAPSWPSTAVEVTPLAEGADPVTAAEAKVGWLMRYGLGRFGFLCQFWLSVISAAVAIFAGQYVYNGGLLVGLGFTVLSNAASWVSVLWTLRCRAMGKRLRREPGAKAPPTKGEVVKLLWGGMWINAHGLFAAIAGIEANSGQLLAQSLSTSPTVMVPGYGRGVAAFDVFAQLAQAQSLFSLLIGLAVGLYTLQVVTQPFARRPDPAPA